MNSCSARHLSPEIAHGLGLLCRIWHSITASGTKRTHNIRLDESGIKVVGPDASVPLSDSERELLVFLLQNTGLIFTPETLLGRIWGIYRIHDRQFLEETVAALSDSLQRAGFAPGLVEDVHGVGYWLRPVRATEPGRPSKQSHRGLPGTTSNAQNTVQE